MDEERRSESIRYRKRGCVRGCPEIAFDGDRERYNYRPLHDFPRFIREESAFLRVIRKTLLAQALNLTFRH